MVVLVHFFYSFLTEAWRKRHLVQTNAMYLCVCGCTVDSELLVLSNWLTNQA